MRPKAPPEKETDDMFRQRLENMINMDHELVKLGEMVDWRRFDEAFGALYAERKGCPGKPVRLMVGLLYLKHIHGLSDGAVVAGWVENPYRQRFCGEEYFQHGAPVDAGSPARFRQRIGESGCGLALSLTVETGVRSKAVRKRDFERVTVPSSKCRSALVAANLSASPAFPGAEKRHSSISSAAWSVQLRVNIGLPAPIRQTLTTMA